MSFLVVFGTRGPWRNAYRTLGYGTQSGENRSPVGSETPQRPFSVLRVVL